VSDSHLRAVGVFFDRGEALLTGYQNGEHFTAHAFDWPGRSVRFLDVSVEAWNFYAAGDAKYVFVKRLG